MKTGTLIQVVGQACLAIYLAPGTVRAAAREEGPLPPLSSGQRGSAPYASDWETVSALLENASSTYTETWDDATCRTLMSGAYLGNGDFGAHLGGTRHSLKYYLGKNGFHAGNDVAAGLYAQHILNLALLTVERPSGTDSGDAYSVTQDLVGEYVRPIGRAPPKP